MEEDVIGLIAQAEAQAAEIKEKAQAEAAEIIAAAEKRAAGIVKESEVFCAQYRVEKFAEAKAEAENAYNAAIMSGKAAAKEYADGIIARSDGDVSDIVGRLLK